MRAFRKGSPSNPVDGHGARPSEEHAPLTEPEPEMASNKLRAAQQEQEDDTQVDMSPMIDMVFLLLIFFIVNATLIIVDMYKRVKVPIARHSERQDDKMGRIVVNVYSDEHAAEAWRLRPRGGRPALHPVGRSS